MGPIHHEELLIFIHHSLINLLTWGLIYLLVSMQSYCHMTKSNLSVLGLPCINKCNSEERKSANSFFW